MCVLCGLLCSVGSCDADAAKLESMDAGGNSSCTVGGLRGVRQVGGGRGRPKKNVTPKGVKKSEPKLSGSGHHMRTRYQKGNKELELCEKVVDETRPAMTRKAAQTFNATANIPKPFNSVARANLFSQFDDVADSAPVVKMPPGISLQSPGTKSTSGRMWGYTFVGFGLALKLEQEAVQPNWSRGEIEAARKWGAASCMAMLSVQ